LRDGQPVALTPKAFETLLTLVRRSGHLMGNDELMKEIWLWLIGARTVTLLLDEAPAPSFLLFSF